MRSISPSLPFEPINKAIITENIESYAESITKNLSPQYYKLFLKDEFVIENSKEVIAESYIAVSHPKLIVMGAKKFNTYAQNSLLKILEEPPRNITYMLITPSKTALLPTVKSRLRIEHLREKRVKEDRLIEIKGLNLQTIFEFNKNNPFLSKEKSRAAIEDIFFQCVELGIRLNEKEALLFGDAHKMVELNQRGSVVITMLLLSILRRRKLASNTARK